MSKIHATVECTIDAPIKTVWEVLTRVDDYSSWNKFVVNINSTASTPTVGTLMDFEVRFPDNKSSTGSKELVTVFEVPVEKDGKIVAKWEYDYASIPSKIGMIKATRVQHLSQDAGQPTRYFSQESFSGWGVRFVPIKKVQAGFDVQAAGLKQAAENAK